MPAPPPPPKGSCSQCGQPDVYLYNWAGSMICANDYRTVAHRTKRVQSCDVCGGLPAFRDPSHRRNEYKCESCHRQSGYVLHDQGMLMKIDRVGKLHPLGRQDPCEAAGHGTECKGQIKPRGKLGSLCDFHANPRKFNAAR